METEHNFLTFIQNHDKHFKKYDDLTSVERSSIIGWLYIFNAYCYDIDITKILPEFTDKFGKTLKELFERLFQYKKEVNINNIEAIQCTLPDERERLIKAYLKLRTPIRPVVGNEYFIKNRNLIKILLLIIVYISDEDIIKYESSYSNSKKNKSDILYIELFNRIERYIEKIKENDEFELKIEENIHTLIPNNEEDKMENICIYCNKQYNSLSSLNYHQKTAKFCLKLQQTKQEENTITPTNFTCEHCEKNFTTKFAITRHYNICNIKILNDKLNHELKLKEEQYLKEKSEIEKQILNFQYELKEKDKQISQNEIQMNTQRLDFLERISKLESTIKEKDTIIAKNLDKLADSVNRHINLL